MTDQQHTIHQYGPPAITRYDVMGIRFMTDPAGGNGGGAGDPGADPGNPDPSQQPSGQQQQGPGANPEGQQQREYTPEETQRYIQRLRSEAATFRTERDANATELETLRGQLAGALTALGQGGEPAAPDPQQQQAAIDAQNGELAQMRRREAVLLEAPTHRADASRLLDSNTFATALAALEPTDRAGIGELVRSTVEGNAYYAAQAPSAASSGGQAHNGPTKQEGRKTGEAAIADAMSKQRAR